MVTKSKAIKTEKLTRNGKELIQFWIDSAKKRLWDERIKGNLSEYIRQAVDDRLMREDQAKKLEEEKRKVDAERVSIEALLDKKLSEFRTSIIQEQHKVPSPSLELLKNRVLKYLDTLGRPAKWEDIVEVMGADRESVLDALKDLVRLELVQMDKLGNYHTQGVSK